MKNLLWACALLLSIAASAQSVKMRGFINDSIGVPLEFANVIATKSGSGDLESYAITNFEGKYQLDLPKNETYIIKASFLGYETQEKTITVAEDGENFTQDFVLNPLASQLDGVEIVYEMPVTVRGDTIIYNADSFKTGEERKLGDVLKNLPGVEVNDDGEIEVEGNAVQKVMIEGKDFFDGDSKLATKNIPADAVDKIEVLRNYNEVGQLRGLGNDQDNVAINIRLKEGKKNFWFGEVTAGGGSIGDEGGYLAHPKLFYYSPKYSLNFITDFNNIGEVPFTFRDYFNFTGGFRNFNQGGGTRFNISDSGLGFAVTQNDRANEINTKFFAGNFSYAVNESLDISGFAIASDNSTNILNNSIRQFIDTGTRETTSSVVDQDNRLGMLKLSAIYKPSTELQVDYDVLLRASSQEEESNVLSQFNDVTNNIEEEKENTPFSINQNLNAYYTLDEKNIFSGQIQHLYQEEDPFYSAAQDVIPFRGIFTVIDETNPDREDSSTDTFSPLLDQNRFNVNQNQDVRTNKIDAKIDHYYVLNNTSNINFTLGTTYSNQKFNSSIFQLLDNGDRNLFEGADFNNDVDFTFSDVFLGVHYKVKSGKFTFTPGATLHNYNVSSDQLGISSSDNEVNILPDLNVIFNLKKSENIRLNYDISSQYTDVSDYATSFVFNNYNRLSRGNRNLENALNHSYRLSYLNFNLFNSTNINGSVSYTRRIDGFKNQTEIININQVSSPFNISSNFPDETFSANGRFSKTIKKVQFNASGSLSVATSNNQINGVIRESENVTQNYSSSLRSNFRDWPNLEIGYRLLVNRSDIDGLIQKFYTRRPFFKLDARFLKDFTVSADWDFYDYTNEERTIENSYSFLNANLYYQESGSKWEFQIQADNLLDTDFINNDTFNDQFNITTQYFVLPRILMFVVKYDL